MAGKGRPFEKGHPGGPGRPPRAAEERDLARLRSIYTREREERVWEKTISQAEGGSIAHAQWLDERLYGLIPRPVAVENAADGEPFAIGVRALPDGILDQLIARLAALRSSG